MKGIKTIIMFFLIIGLTIFLFYPGSFFNISAPLKNQGIALKNQGTSLLEKTKVSPWASTLQKNFNNHCQQSLLEIKNDQNVKKVFQFLRSFFLKKIFPSLKKK